MINIILNGTPVTLEQPILLSELLEQKAYDLNVGGFAVAINYIFIPRQQYTHVLIQENDNIEIVIPMQGG